MRMKKWLTVSLAAMLLVGGSVWRRAEAQMVEFGQYSFRMWLPDRFSSGISSSSSKSFHYSSSEEGSSEFEINVISDSRSVESIISQQASWEGHSYGTSIIDEDVSSDFDSRPKGYIIWNRLQMERYKVAGLIYADLGNGKKVQVKFSMPDTEDNRKDFYVILSSFESYDAYQGGGYNYPSYPSAPSNSIDAYEEARVLVNRGVDLNRAGRTQEALDCYNRALELNPSYAMGYYDRGYLYRVNKKYQLAIEDLTRAIDLKSDYAEAYNNRGNCYNAVEEYARAVEDFTNAIRYTKNKQDRKMNYVNRGIMYRSLKQYAESVQDFKTVLAEDANYSDAYYHLSVTYKRMENYSEALATVNKFLSLEVANANGYDLRAEIYEKLGNTALAEADKTKAKKLRGEL